MGCSDRKDHQRSNDVETLSPWGSWNEREWDRTDWETDRTGMKEGVCGKPTLIPEHERNLHFVRKMISYEWQMGIGRMRKKLGPQSTLHGREEERDLKWVWRLYYVQINPRSPSQAIWEEKKHREGSKTSPGHSPWLPNDLWHLSGSIHIWCVCTQGHTGIFHKEHVRHSNKSSRSLLNWVPWALIYALQWMGAEKTILYESSGASDGKNASWSPGFFLVWRDIYVSVEVFLTPMINVPIIFLSPYFRRINF